MLKELGMEASSFVGTTLAFLLAGVARLLAAAGISSAGAGADLVVATIDFSVRMQLCVHVESGCGMSHNRRWMDLVGARATRRDGDGRERVRVQLADAIRNRIFIK